MSQGQEQLFYEDVYEAMKAVVAYLGGAQKVGPKMWPKKSDRQAWKDLLDCLNRNNDRKLDPEEIIMLFRMGRDAGFHSAWHWVNGEAGYHKPSPTSPTEEAESILTRAADLARESRAVALQLERLHQTGALKSVVKTASG